MDDGTLVEISSGSVYVETVGSGQPVIALPGFAGTARTWRQVAEELSDSFSVHMVDFLGYGLSDKPSAADHSPVGQARQIEEVMAKLGISRCVLLSNSASAQPALQAAFRQPRRFVANVMVAPFVAPGMGPELLSRVAGSAMAKSVLSALFGLRAFIFLANSLGRHPSNPGDDDAVDLQYLAYGSDGYWEALARSAKYLRPRAITGIMQMIGAPTLVILGDSDRTGSVDRARAVLSKIPSCRFEVVPECGHVVQEERPTRTARLIRAFVSSLKDGSAKE